MARDGYDIGNKVEVDDPPSPAFNGTHGVGFIFSLFCMAQKCGG
jgi:hypothetical protein